MQQSFAIEGMAPDKDDTKAAQVADKFLGEWRDQLEIDDYSESALFHYFSKWYVTHYGTTEESLDWLLPKHNTGGSRIIRTLQDKAKHFRKLSGK